MQRGIWCGKSKAKHGDLIRTRLWPHSVTAECGKLREVQT